MMHSPTQEKKYMAENDLRTLIEASKIKRDKSRYSAAMTAAKEQRKALADVADKTETQEKA